MRPDLPVITPDSFNLSNIKNMYRRTDIGQIEILGALPGVGTFQGLLGRATNVTIGGVVCPVIDLDSLLKAKRIAGRDKDRPAIEELEFLRDLKRRKQGGDAAS
jgi:predicted nucleotidyltransferase